jgi:glycosyltransferase involved in cell wall biosynthesis
MYYWIKPLIPPGVRLSVRRWLAAYKRPSVDKLWPIAPGSETKPTNWPGWPEGKKFALVLTHDVEGQEGYNKSLDLMRIEKELGYRSSFNFIPEGTYHVTKQIREELTRNGFEVGVHDLKHDGKLYRTRRHFSKRAIRINHYIKEWNASGFRSGFMLHNLNWLHDLDIKYDASTFDTDPFEPQPDSRNTIFPFWVSNGSGGYAELPYTLPQDSTLFLLLREDTLDLWIKKLDWIAMHGGMALLNVHPDYVNFDDRKVVPRTFPVAKYSEFLKYVNIKYGQTFWQPLPREMANFVSAAKPKLPRKSARRVCMITHSYYENDNRVTRYAEALANRGDEVEIIALRRDEQTPAEEVIGGVKVHRLQTRAGKKEQSKMDYFFPLLRFLFISSFWVTRGHRRKAYDLVHVHNIPDFMVFAAWYPKLAGAGVLLDIHDIVPEFYASKFAARKYSPAVFTLKRVERASAAFADHVILANHLWLEKYASRSAVPGKCSVFINHVDPNIFRPVQRKRDDGKLIVLFPGGLQWHQGIDIAIRAFKQITQQFPQAEFHIYGDGNMKPQLIQLAQNLELNGKVHFFEPLRIRQIAGVMANADLGVVPKRADSFGNEAYSTKIMEFMSVGVPVIVSNTKIDQYYFNDSTVRFFESGNAEKLSEVMLEMLGSVELRERMVSQAREYVAHNSWEIRKSDYLDLVDSLCQTKMHG